MAEDKKIFLAYADWIHSFDNLEDDEAGRLVKHIFRYVNDLNPEIGGDRILQISFEPIKQQLKRDLKKYEFTKEEKSNSGALGNLKRWNIDLYLKVINNELDINKAIEIAKGRYAIKKSQGVANIAVKVTDTDTVTDIYLEKELLNSFSMIEQCMRILKEKKPSVETRLKDFISEQKAIGGFEKRKIEDVRKHFINSMKLVKPSTETINGTGGRSFA